MSELAPDTAEFLEQLKSELDLAPDEVERLQQFAAWATPNRLAFLRTITTKVADSLIPTGWHELPSSPLDDQKPESRKPTPEQLMAQSGFVMLREWATGRKSPPDSAWTPPRFPSEQVLHFCRVWALMETGYVAPQIVTLVGVVGDAEQQLQTTPEDANAKRQLALSTSQLDLVMEHSIAEQPEVERLVDLLYLFLVTDDEDEALTLDLAGD